MTMRSTLDGDVLTIALDGHIDADVAYQPYEEMAARTGQDGNGITKVILDVGGVIFADSTALGTMVRMNEHAHDVGVSLEVHNTPPRLRRLLDMTALSGEFTLT